MDTPPNSTPKDQTGGHAPMAQAPMPPPLNADELNTLHALAQAIMAMSRSGQQAKTDGQAASSDTSTGASSTTDQNPPVVPSTADYASAAAQLAVYQVASPSMTASWFAFVPPAVAAADAAINPKRRDQALRGLAVSGAIGLLGFMIPRLIR